MTNTEIRVDNLVFSFNRSHKMYICGNAYPSYRANWSIKDDKIFIDIVSQVTGELSRYSFDSYPEFALWIGKYLEV